MDGVVFWVINTFSDGITGALGKHHWGLSCRTVIFFMAPQANPSSGSSYHFFSFLAHPNLCS